jgi:hypothetical protein
MYYDGSSRMRLVAGVTDAGIRVSVKRAHLAFVAFAEGHDEASSYEIHGLETDKHGITNYRRMNQKEQ